MPEHFEIIRSIKALYKSSFLFSLPFDKAMKVDILIVDDLIYNVFAFLVMLQNVIVSD